MALMNVIDWKNRQGEILYRLSGGSISLGAQLHVAEGQDAVLFKDGRALDVFGPGRHSLREGNIPLLEKTVSLEPGGNSHFPADLFYLTRAEVPGLKWETTQPVVLTDPVYAIDVPIRAFGSFAFAIMDPKSFLSTAAGMWHASTTGAVEAALRDRIILPGLFDIISELMMRDAIPILKLASHYDEIGRFGKEKLSGDFARCGLDLSGFSIESITVPQEDDSVQKLRNAVAKGAGAAMEAGEPDRLERTIASMEKSEESDAVPVDREGAETEIAMEERAADGTGQEGAVACPHCNAQNITGAKFCTSCGKELAAGPRCPRCNAGVPVTAKFCPECGASLTPGTCVTCGYTLRPDMKFCPECGTRQG